MLEVAAAAAAAAAAAEVKFKLFDEFEGETKPM